MVSAFSGIRERGDWRGCIMGPVCAAPSLAKDQKKRRD